MTTEKQQEANQQNALLSTGPTSVEGKENSSQGAISHGMTCKKHLILSWERWEDYWEFFHIIEGDLQPVGSQECLLVKKIIDNMWRLRRGARYEVMVEKECPNVVAFLSEVYKISRYESQLERRIAKDRMALENLQMRRKMSGNPMMSLGQTQSQPKTYTHIEAEQVIPPAMLGKNTWADFFANQQVGYPKNTNGFVLSKQTSITPVSTLFYFLDDVIRHPSLAGEPVSC